MTGGSGIALPPTHMRLQARELMMKGCELCPSNEDVWLEAARLQVGGRPCGHALPWESWWCCLCGWRQPACRWVGNNHRPVCGRSTTTVFNWSNCPAVAGPTPLPPSCC